MKNNLNFYAKVATCCVLTFSAVLLSSCGENNNLPDPSQVTVSTKCSDLANTTCVAGVFVDDVVGNLDYKCGGVSGALTAENGAFSCPVGSTVTFSIINPNDPNGKKIVLGQTLVKLAANLGPGVKTYFYVTPYNLSSDAVVVKNIVRLLQAWGTVGASLDSPARAIFIPPVDKGQLSLLSQSIDSTDAVNGSVFNQPQTGIAGDQTGDPFGYALKPFMSHISKALLDTSVVDDVLKKGHYSTVAGLYYNPGFNLSVLGTDPGDMRGQTTSNYLIGATWTLVDRKGRIFGFGVYSTGATTPTSSCAVMLPNAACPRPNMRIRGATTPWPTWRDDNVWSIAYDLFDDNDAIISGNTLTMAGVVDRDAVAGSSDRYKSIYGEAPPATATLGTWKANLGAGKIFDETNTRFTLVRGSPVAPSLDPALWTSAGPTALSFPMNIVATFRSSTGCSGTNCPLVGAPLHFTVLEDGNIVSNLPDPTSLYSCSTNMTTLMGSNGVQQYPLGTVAQIYTSDAKTKTYINPMMLVPDILDATSHPMFGVLNGIQIGTVFSPTVRIRVDSAAGAAKLHTYNDTALDSNGNSTDVDTAPGTALWSNLRATLNNDNPNGAGTFTTAADTVCP
jgi:hypothetical protein